LSQTAAHYGTAEAEAPWTRFAPGNGTIGKAAVIAFPPGKAIRECTPAL
jgi:hypothetical protein